MPEGISLKDILDRLADELSTDSGERSGTWKSKHEASLRATISDVIRDLDIKRVRGEGTKSNQLYMSADSANLVIDALYARGQKTSESKRKLLRISEHVRDRLKHHLSNLHTRNE